MIVGGYTLDLYCDNPGLKHNTYASDYSVWVEADGEEYPYQFIGETRAECLRYARNAGWYLGRDGLAVCPVCASRGFILDKVRRLLANEKLEV